ncbi:MAG: hypothetical protein KF779_18640 [Hyphomonadaceae bacterium]|nr:hypothetical protein [Hyphomonadaceae bacterium]
MSETEGPTTALRESGAPQQVIDYVLAQRPTASFALIYTILFLAVMLSGCGVGALFWEPLGDLTVRNAVDHARAENALLFEANFGFSLVIAIFGWIFASGSIANLILLRTPRLRASYLIFNATHSRRWFERTLLKRSLRRVAELSDPKAYVDAWISQGNRMMLIAGVVGLSIAGLALVRDVNTHTVYTATHYIRAPFFPWGASEPRPWRDAARVELGCNHVEGRNASDSIIYRVDFGDGDKVSLESGMPLPGGDWLRSARTIDAELRAGDAKFERWSWMNRDPLHEACLNVMRRNFGADYPQIERLLRIGELPDR